MKAIVLYYSQTGNTEIIAKKIAKDFSCELVKIEPDIVYGGFLSSCARVIGDRLKKDLPTYVTEIPDLSEIDNILDEQGDEIFKDADSIVVEFDMEKATLKRVFELAKKYDKDVYAVVSNMSIAIARRDLIRQNACFVCNLQEAGIFFSEK